MGNQPYVDLRLHTSGSPKTMVSDCLSVTQAWHSANDHAILTL